MTGVLDGKDSYITVDEISSRSFTLNLYSVVKPPYLIFLFEATTTARGGP